MESCSFLYLPVMGGKSHDEGLPVRALRIISPRGEAKLVEVRARDIVVSLGCKAKMKGA